MARRTSTQSKSKTYKNKLPLVRIEWQDAAGAASWTPLDQIEGLRDIAHCVTVGFLVRKTKDGYYLIMGYAHGDEIDDGMQPFFIPLGMVKKITRLK